MQFFHLSGVSLAPRIAVGILSLAHRGVLLRLRRRRRPTHTTEPTKTAAAAAAERARARRLQNKLFWNECVDGFGFQVGESNDRCSAVHGLTQGGGSPTLGMDGFCPLGPVNHFAQS